LCWFFIRPQPISYIGFCVGFLFDHNQFRALAFVLVFYSTENKFGRWLLCCFFIRPKTNLSVGFCVVFFIRPQPNSTQQVENNISNSFFIRRTFSTDIFSFYSINSNIQHSAGGGFFVRVVGRQKTAARKCVLGLILHSVTRFHSKIRFHKLFFNIL